MHKTLGVALASLAITLPAAAQTGGGKTAFTLNSRTLKTLTQAQLTFAQAKQTVGKKSKGKLSLTFSQSPIRLVVSTGPEDDMLSYRIQGLRNPTLTVPANAVLNVLFVNTDGDMPHDIHFGAQKPLFPLAPGLKGAVGTTRLPHSESGKFSGEEILLRAASTGTGTYFCSVRGHAKGGMFGFIGVGTAPVKTVAPPRGVNTREMTGMDAMAGMDMAGMDMAGMDMSGSATPAKASGNAPATANQGSAMPGQMPATPKQAARTGSTVPTNQTSANQNGGMSGMQMPMQMPGMQMPATPTPAATVASTDQATGSNANATTDFGNTERAMAMHSTVDLNDPMSRESSGTAWLPDSSPMYMRMRMKGDKMLMVHGTAFPRFTRIGSARDVSSAGKGGRSRFDAPTMFMGMFSQPAGKNAQLGLRAMTSLDPIIERGYGYPLLYQSGEAFRGQPIHDRQHPHDLISELSATYSRRLARGNSAYLYLGYPGEPALGPPTFMHRVSGMDNPDAPISHHWQDSTHITFGVATLGYSTGKIKLEGSAFKGEEPDENRYNFDRPRLDSISTRLSWNPTRDLAFQVSSGYLKRPEPAEPEVSSRHRTTASVILNRASGEDINWANSLVWGQNRDAGEGKSNAYLFESSYRKRANTFYGRFERVQKSGHELVLSAPNDTRLFGVATYAVGVVHDVKRDSGLDVGVGAQVTFGTNPSGLDSIYGGGSHTGFQLFLRLRPSRMRVGSMNMSSGAMNNMNMDGNTSGASMSGMPGM